MFRAAAIVRREARRAAGPRRRSSAHTRRAGYTIQCGGVIVECAESIVPACKPGTRLATGGHWRRAGGDGCLGDGEDTCDVGDLGRKWA